MLRQPLAGAEGRPDGGATKSCQPKCPTTKILLLRFTYYSDAPDSPDGLLSDLRSLWNCHYILQSSIVDELESELEAMQDERRESVECMRLMRLIINHAKHEYCDQLILCE